MAGETEAGGELRLFPGDKVRRIAAQFLEDHGAKEGISAELRGGTNRGIPLHVRKQIVDRRFGRTLAPPAADHGDGRMMIQITRRVLEPCWIQCRVAIKELQIGNVGMPSEK